MVAFALVNHEGRDTLHAGSAAAQTATVGKPFHRPLRARATDGAGEPIEGVSVTFTLPAAASGAGATFAGGGSQATAVTGEDGWASSPALVANATAGRFTATASVPGFAASARYPLRTVAGAAGAIAAGAASGQAAVVGRRFAIPLAVTVDDANGNPVTGALVAFAAPAAGAGGRFAGGLRIARVRTDADGIAVAPRFRANRRAGGFAVIATVAGAHLHAAFALVNRQTAA